MGLSSCSPSFLRILSPIINHVSNLLPERCCIAQQSRQPVDHCGSGCLRPHQIPGRAPWWQEDPAASSRQGCQQTVLEVPQRVDPQEVLETAPGPGAVSPQPGPAASEEAEAMDQYGDMIPYADPSWYQTYHTPYFNETHAALRAEVREWMEEEVMPYVTEWDEAKKVPDSIYKPMGERGYLAGLLGMHPYPSQLAGGKTIKSVPPEKWDLFHEMLLTDEMSRCGSGGFVWNVIGGFGIGCPPLVKHGKKELVQRILPEILNGDKRICLAITEPDAGSDVANLTCEAKLSEDGKHYIVNGEKKWITNGIWCDYFTTAVRTGGEGMNGVSVLLIERSMGGVSTRRMDCQGVWSSGTTYVTFEDVKVPVEN